MMEVLCTIQCVGINQDWDSRLINARLKPNGDYSTCTHGAFRKNSDGTYNHGWFNKDCDVVFIKKGWNYKPNYGRGL